ncbi:hypothetical protein HBI56_047400 [Parastagonospora nodorum]|uniref:Uncharacterized protein n=2 Tax=Phaeosphaeria nodorum (strain SN15 / ATCC MYA-4574 / FGSC 10173) TaxID=321614 RepID=A0A7U2HX28_PHANO|nr:hypothetical protein HBH56_060320 [Parastagonospora nodorum]QRC91876.1 hypothetical protein JI435_020610 [Parastagonospora nodorum SN15]KAH3930823.1 hypothetical protein HBH54_104250 [Parastagonospora nodorum]KAH4074155.1 hypothetical protein HBH50_043240 [Parastagonospora nodorum]KAH4082236.1 hypothetical protein HBH48_191780 [Parastagonospora nodorum]
MDPPSPSKLGMSPPWKPFALSPERAAGTIPPYDGPLPQSPSAPLLSSIPPLSPTRSPNRSPIRGPMHRRTDSDVSVQGLAVMFEGLEVKDPREAVQRYKQMLEKEKSKWAEKFHRHEKDHSTILERKALRIEELESELAQARSSLQVGVSKDQYEKEWKAHKANVKKWEQVFKDREERWTSDSIKVKTLEEQNRVLEQKYRQHQKHARQMQTENLKVTNMVPTMQAKVQSLEKEVRRTRSDLDYKSREADNYKNQVYSLQVEFEGAVARLSEEVQTLKDTLKSVEGERDTLKTSLKEEEVMRIAAEGHIPLPTAGADEHDEFGSPVRSPRKPRSVQREDDDKENVAPKKSAVEYKLLQQELATEKRLRERAQDQIDFMKMECQFQCCSCRIAENKGKAYVHDDTYDTQMQHIKTSVPVYTPPASAHEDDVMEGVLMKQEPVENERPFTPPADEVRTAISETESSNLATEAEAVIAFSPSTGTFKAIPSPVKAPASTHVDTPAKTPNLDLSTVTETFVASSPCAPDAPSVVPEAVNRRSMSNENKTACIDIHEDAMDEEDEEESEPQVPTQEHYEPATPARYELHTTTTTIPIAFSPATPAFRPGLGPMTPSTIAHAASDAQTPVLGELSLNLLPIDREKALQKIRERRGRARSFAAGHGTPMKQMVEGVKERRDISAPVSRARR